MNETIKPNTLLIGAQKCATTSIYNWIAQHPDVCGPSALKDYAFFINDSFYEKGIELFKNDYINSGYKNQKIVMHGSVNYIFFKEAIDRIYEFNPEIKFILVLRNPIDRTISAYNYQKKMKKEDLTFKEAIEKEEIRAKGTLQEKSDLTYVAHSKYGEQLDYLLSKFKREQLYIIFFEDLEQNQDKVIKEVFNYLNIENDFKPQYNILNRTGSLKSKILQSLIFSQNEKKKYFVKIFLDPFLPLSKRINIKNKFKEWNTIKKKENYEEQYSYKKQILEGVFYDDIKKLEKLLDLDLSHWK